MNVSTAVLMSFISWCYSIALNKNQPDLRQSAFCIDIYLQQIDSNVYTCQQFVDASLISLFCIVMSKQAA